MTSNCLARNIQPFGAFYAITRLNPIEVKMEQGPIASAYEAKPIQEELRDVQRYELIIGSADLDSVGIAGYAGAASETAYQTIAYPTTMRLKPAASIDTFSVANTNQPIVEAGVNSLTLKIQALAAGRMAARSNTLNRPIFLDAEL